MFNNEKYGVGEELMSDGSMFRGRFIDDMR